jgi:hypothetical protein
MKLIGEKLKVINVGARSFYESIVAQGGDAVHVDWRPPAGGDPELARLLDGLQIPEIDEANRLALERMLSALPLLTEVKPAIEAIPGMKEDIILHPGPPIDWERMCGPMRGAVIGALLYEGLADSPEKAEKLARKGEISFSPAHHHNAVGGMANVISASMQVFVVKDNGKSYYSVVREGKNLRFGSFSKDVIDRLKWTGEIFGPSMNAALAEGGPIDLRDLIARALLMGDECHSRCIATTLLFENELIPRLLKADVDREIISQIISFLKEDQNFGLCLVMGAAKAITHNAHGIKNSTIVTAMTRNGVDFGIRVGGLGDKWFTAPSPSIDGIFFPGFGPEDASPDMGDSAIVETSGLGGMAMAAAPAIAQLKGHKDPYQSAIKYTMDMYEITFGKNKFFTLPALNFIGTPMGIDIRKVAETGIVPYINTAIAHKEMGHGLIGIGLARAPMDCFTRALKAFANKFG